MDITEARKKAKALKGKQNKGEERESKAEAKLASRNEATEAKPEMPLDNTDEAKDLSAEVKKEAAIRNQQSATKTADKSTINNRQSETIRVLVFKLAEHEHAVDVRQVREILGAPVISPVVEAPDFVEGVIKHRGRVVPIVGLRRRLRLPTAEKTLQTCIILVRSGKKMVGWVVDSASELLSVPTARIEAPSEIVGGIRTRFIEGVVYLDDRFLVILKLDEILSVNEKEMLDFGFENNLTQRRKDAKG